MLKLETIVALAKRRGFVYPTSEIYGGFNGFWDYGPLGVELKNNIKREWWKSMVYARPDVVGLDAAVIMNPQVWKASGHVDAFTDPLVECKSCHSRFRADHFTEVQDKKKERSLWIEKWSDFYRAKHGLDDENDLSKASHAYQKFSAGGITPCPNCEDVKGFTEPKSFNLLTEVFLGATEPKTKAYLRGEITQGVFVNFKNVVNSTRVKIPFGIGQIGKAFRNEVTPGNFTFRSREFEQMELEYFVEPDNEESKKTFEYWKHERFNWYVSLGINKDNLRFREHEEKERAHYARFAEDIEYNAPFGWSEFEGIHHRGDWDLSRHKIKYLDQQTNKEFTPYVIETSGGVDRAALFFLIDAYHEEKERVVLKLHKKLAPYKIAVFPLLANKEELVKKAREIFEDLQSSFVVYWDDRGNIGKRYRYQDEMGTPYCVTVDFDSLDDQRVTVRDRDSMQQERVEIKALKSFFQKKYEK